MKQKELVDILKNKGIYLTKKRGQNFLVDDSVIISLLKRIDILKSDTIIEIGTGFGALTKKLLEFDANVISYETDRKVFQTASELLAGYEKLKLVHVDFLKLDLLEEFEKFKKVRIIANIPYNISSQILIKLWYVKEYVSDIYILIQKEVGQRLISFDKAKEVSLLLVVLQMDFTIRMVKNVKKQCFFPEPKVDSVYLEIKPKKNNVINQNDRERFFKFVKFCFLNRRKKLLPKLKKTYKFTDEDFELLKIDKNIRVDKLKLFEWEKIWNRFNTK